MLPGAPDGESHPSLLLRPLVRVVKIALFEREVRERLGRAALDIIFAHAEVMSEGQRETRAGRTAYFGSTMLTIDLPPLADVLREPLDAGCAERLARLLGADASVAERCKAIADREVLRIVGARPQSTNAEVRSRWRGTQVFLDVDVEASL